MKDWLAAKSMLWMVLILAGALLANYGLVVVDRQDWLAPSPENVADQFVGALGAHRYAGAMEQLSQDLQQQVEPQELRDIVARIERAHEGIYDVESLGDQEQGDSAQAQVEVTLRDETTQQITFTLKKENGLWKIESIDPLNQLAGE